MIKLHTGCFSTHAAHHSTSSVGICLFVFPCFLRTRAVVIFLQKSALIG
jgi:hypothetical protein